MLTYSFLRMEDLSWGTGIWAVTTLELVSLSLWSGSWGGEGEEERGGGGGGRSS